ncbi:peptidoglycan-binding domain-containing protein [Evansella clarkii]|uniref:peptidoglycan-binding domain-containing protein n=1 Tax=Evansella clarkii TaxID=79879 RepID=UPI0009985CCA|nr:peptidoglycan-binding protein [Evansella clarkii]
MSIDNQIITADSRRRWVEMLQKQLIRENPSALPVYGVDGIYGPETTEWVRRFQQRKGLQVDGIAGPITLGRLRSDIIQRPGATGRGVEILQEDLLYFYIRQSSVDGIYGPGTEQGVRDFQYLNNLVVDGIAGPNTLRRMDELITTILVQRGDTGSLVRRIQEQLNEQDAVDVSLVVDGIYGPLTESAVESFQAASNLNVDGIAGPYTMNRLDMEAVHPLSLEELMEFAQFEAEEPESLSESEQAAYISSLQANNVFQSTRPPGTGDSIDAVAFLDSGSYDFGNAAVVTGTYGPSLNFFLSYLNANTHELLVHFVFETDGLGFTDNVKMTAYDVDGNDIESYDQTWVDFSYDSLSSAMDLADRVNSAQESMILVDMDELREDARCAILVEAGCINLGLIGAALTPAAMMAIYGACSITGSIYTELHGCGLPE